MYDQYHTLKSNISHRSPVPHYVASHSSAVPHYTEIVYSSGAILRWGDFRPARHRTKVEPRYIYDKIYEYLFIFSHYAIVVDGVHY